MTEADNSQDLRLASRRLRRADGNLPVPMLAGLIFRRADVSVKVSWQEKSNIIIHK
jgi:hypothetical protein